MKPINVEQLKPHTTEPLRTECEPFAHVDRYPTFWRSLFFNDNTVTCERCGRARQMFDGIS